MSDSLKAKIQEAMKSAMRAKEKERLAVIRLIQAAIKQREVDERIELDDEQVLLVLDKMLKQRRESIFQFEKADRDDLVAVEVKEIEVIKTFMPEPLSEADIENIINEAISQSGASSIKEMGKVMGIVKPQVQGKADVAQVSKTIKQRLGA